MVYFLALACIEKIYQTLEASISPHFQTLHFIKNAPSANLIFNSLFGVWKCDETRFLVFDVIMYRT